MTESKILPLLTWRSSICDSDLPSTTRLVALALSLYMNERGGSAFPGADKLAKATGLTDRAVRDHLHKLVDTGWLVLVERGGVRGEVRRANHYRASTPEPPSVVPLNLIQCTPEPDDAHPCTTFTPSLQELSITTGEAETSSAPDTRISTLVASYVDDYKIERSGHQPSRAFKSACGKAVKNALNDGESVDDISRALGVIAHESKNPSTLPYVLADYHAGRPRRIQ